MKKTNKEYRLMTLVINSHGEVIQGDILMIFEKLEEAKEALQTEINNHYKGGYPTGCHGGYAIEIDNDLYDFEWLEYVDMEEQQ